MELEIPIPAHYEVPNCQFAKAHLSSEAKCEGKDFWADVALETVRIAIHPRTRFRFYAVQAFHVAPNKTSEEGEVRALGEAIHGIAAVRFMMTE